MRDREGRGDGDVEEVGSVKSLQGYHATICDGGEFSLGGRKERMVWGCVENEKGADELPRRSLVQRLAPIEKARLTQVPVSGTVNVILSTCRQSSDEWET